MIAWLWAGFVLFVVVMLALDLFVVNRKAHVINTREALGWTGVCVLLGLAFTVAVYFIYRENWFEIASKFREMSEGAAADPKGLGKQAAMQFLSGWLIEYSLSMDNIFVMALIFAHFRVPAQHQHRVLFWGILGALILRGVMIGLGAALVHRFEWILYIFGGVLVFTAVRLLKQGDEDIHPERGFVLRAARKLLPISPSNDGQRFTTRIAGKLVFTPLFVVLLVVETTDVVFAIDSIPAIFGITRDPFLVFTSNVFAIMGLRSLYFALAALMDRFQHLKFSLSFILAFVGVKMLLEGADLARRVAGWAWKDGIPSWLDWLPDEGIHIPAGVSLAVIVAALTVGIGTSLVATRNKTSADSGDA